MLSLGTIARTGDALPRRRRGILSPEHNGTALSFFLRSRENETTLLSVRGIQASESGRPFHLLWPRNGNGQCSSAAEVAYCAGDFGPSATSYRRCCYLARFDAAAF